MNLSKSSLGSEVEAIGIYCFLQNIKELAEDYFLSKKNRIFEDDQGKFNFSLIATIYSSSSLLPHTFQAKSVFIMLRLSLSHKKIVVKPHSEYHLQATQESHCYSQYFQVLLERRGQRLRILH